jgi:hypothetical protein
MTAIISLKDYWQGRDDTYPADFTSEIVSNAQDLLARVNQLLTRLDVDTYVTSGWRPAAYNKKIGGAPNSYHISAKAIDLADTHGLIAYKILQNHEILSQLGLWLEWPGDTSPVFIKGVPMRSGWVHLDMGKRTARKLNTFPP